MEGVRVIRKAEAVVAADGWSPLRLHWAVSAELVESRHVCGGWFGLPRGTGSGWRGCLSAESAWYLTEGWLDVGWRKAAGGGQARISEGTFLYVPPRLAFGVRGEAGAAGLVLFGGAASTGRVAGAAEAEGSDGRPWIARVDELPRDTGYEPPLDMRWGVTDRLGGARLLCGARTLNPPRGRIQHHYHDGVEAVIFFLRGRFRIFSGPARDPIDVRPGDVAYIPPGTLHSYASLEAAGMAEEVAFYGGVASKEAAGTVFVDAPGVVDPGRGVG